MWWFIFSMICFTIIIVFDYYSSETFIYSDDPICNKLYETPNNIERAVIKNLLTDEECDHIMNEGIEYAKNNKWTLKRHDDYPTTDNQITFDWKCYDLLQFRLTSRVYEELAKLFHIDSQNLGLNEMFIAKYEPTKQNNLIKHTDGSEFSFIIALNDDYEGGGTYFTKEDTIVKLHKGDCLIFSGQNEHQGNATTSGRRFIVTGFLHYISENYCCYDLLTIAKDYFVTI